MKKLDLGHTDPVELTYAYQKEMYKLEDSDDFDIFVERYGDASEVDLDVKSPQISPKARLTSAPSESDSTLSGPNVPVLDESTLITRTPARGKSGAISIHRVPPSVGGVSGVSGSGRDSILYPPPKDKPLVNRMKAPKSRSVAPTSDSASVYSKRQTNHEAMLPHKNAFDEFHSQRGVRLLRGSLGPVNNVPMMLKNGYRHVYVSRSFALDHGFIPMDTAPGTYGYNGITNLGKWPIQVGSKAVACTVMLAEDSFFPVVLGRSFMEKRGVRTDPIDMTSVIFMDNGERADVEVVVVRDELGQPVSIP